MQLRNRIVMAPIGTNLADAGGAVTPALISWYAERARGGAGLIIVENTLADVRFGRGLARQLRIDHPMLTPGLNELVEAVKAEGAKIAIQINIQGAGVDPELLPGVSPVGASPLSYIFDPSGPGSSLPARMRREKAGTGACRGGDEGAPRFIRPGRRHRQIRGFRRHRASRRPRVSSCRFSLPLQQQAGG